MPVGYVVSVAIVAWCTLFALAPPMPSHSSPASAAYVFGFMANEVPFVAFYAIAASTAGAAAQDDLVTPLGVVGAAIASLTTIGLAVIARRGAAARPALARALDEGLGASPHDGRRVPRRHPWARVLLAPYPIRTRRVQRTRNRPYGDGGRQQRLDVYRRRGATGGPILIHFHGGAFRSGRKSREARPLLHRFARDGWVCISANYRLAPHARFPDHVVDAKRVIAWAREHGQVFGGDPSTIVVAGSSAGAHMAATAALTVDDPRFQPGFESADTSVAGVVCLYGFYGSPDGEPGVPSSPSAYLRHGATPPFFVAHGDQDTLVLVEDARRFVASLRAVSAGPVVYAELTGAQHGFDLFRSLRFEAVVDAIQVFTAEVIAGRGGA